MFFGIGAWTSKLQRSTTVTLVHSNYNLGTRQSAKTTCHSSHVLDDVKWQQVVIKMRKPRGRS